MFCCYLENLPVVPQRKEKFMNRRRKEIRETGKDWMEGDTRALRKNKNKIGSKDRKLG